METCNQHEGHSRPTMFKSYYVVWKQIMIITENKKIKRLNRTMQYGNRTPFLGD